MTLSDQPEKNEPEPGPLERMNAILNASGKASAGNEEENKLKQIFQIRNKKPRKAPGQKKPFRFQREKVQAAYWNVTGTLSLVVNVILIAALILLSRETFALKRLVGGTLIDDLYTNFGKLDEAHIRTNIPVQDTITVNFPLQITQNTLVTLTQDMKISNARVSLVTGGLNIFSAPTDILLPAGTILPVQLNLTVEVNQEVPVNLNVAVDIPLADTELHEPFSNLQAMVEPLRSTFTKGPSSWEQLPACQKMRGLCDWWYR